MRVPKIPYQPKCRACQKNFLIPSPGATHLFLVEKKRKKTQHHTQTLPQMPTDPVIHFVSKIICFFLLSILSPCEVRYTDSKFYSSSFELLTVRGTAR